LNSVSIDRLTHELVPSLRTDRVFRQRPQGV